MNWAGQEKPKPKVLVGLRKLAYVAAALPKPLDAKPTKPAGSKHTPDSQTLAEKNPGNHRRSEALDGILYCAGTGRWDLAALADNLDFEFLSGLRTRSASLAGFTALRFLSR